MFQPNGRESWDLGFYQTKFVSAIEYGRFSFVLPWKPDEAIGIFYTTVTHLIWRSQFLSFFFPFSVQFMDCDFLFISILFPAFLFNVSIIHTLIHAHLRYLIPSKKRISPFFPHFEKKNFFVDGAGRPDGNRFQRRDDPEYKCRDCSHSIFHKRDAFLFLLCVCVSS